MKVSKKLASGVLLFSTCIFNASWISAQNDEAIPDLSGIWDGGGESASCQRCECALG